MRNKSDRTFTQIGIAVDRVDRWRCRPQNEKAKPPSSFSIEPRAAAALFSIEIKMRALGLEPRTHGLKGRCSTD